MEFRGHAVLKKRLRARPFEAQGKQAHSYHDCTKFSELLWDGRVEQLAIRALAVMMAALLLPLIFLFSGLFSGEN